MSTYSSLADDYYINLNLNTEMQLPNTRETILGFFERVQKTFPSMRNFHTRENGDCVLEEDRDQGHQRWISLEPSRICSGFINPPEPDDSYSQHDLVLQLVPYMLSVSPLDCEALDYVVGFDFTFQGNHDALIAETFGTGTAMESFIDVPGACVLNFDPTITIALDESCRRQARLSIETRTNAYQVKNREFGEDPISVYFTVRQYGSLETETSYQQTLLELKEQSEELIESYAIENVLQPLAKAIATH